MRVEVNFGTEKQDIIALAKEIKATFVVVWKDHYVGNTKGYYQNIQQFIKSKVFSWNYISDGRGAIRVWLTDEDVPKLITEREKIIGNIQWLEREERIAHQKINNLFPLHYEIDGRWSVNNPKRIEAEKYNAKKNKALKKMITPLRDKIAKLKEILQADNLVSATMWNCLL